MVKKYPILVGILMIPLFYMVAFIIDQLTQLAFGLPKDSWVAHELALLPPITFLVTVWRGYHYKLRHVAAEEKWKGILYRIVIILCMILLALFILTVVVTFVEYL